MDYLRHQKAVSSTLLQNVPIFGAALLQILRLLKELITVSFLPFDIELVAVYTEFTEFPMWSTLLRMGKPSMIILAI